MTANNQSNLIQSGTFQQHTMCSWPQQLHLIQTCANGMMFVRVYTSMQAACVYPEQWLWAGIIRQIDAIINLSINTTACPSIQHWKGSPCASMSPVPLACVQKISLKAILHMLVCYHSIMKSHISLAEQNIITSRGHTVCIHVQSTQKQ